MVLIADNIHRNTGWDEVCRASTYNIVLVYMCRKHHELEYNDMIMNIPSVHKSWTKGDYSYCNFHNTFHNNVQH